jgi:large conductance mechanosensitive channel
MLQGFKSFILRGNVVDLAIGVVVGSAFGAVVSSLVKDLITPFISAIGGQPDFSTLSFTIHGSRFMYGDFLNALISFLLVAGVVYFLVVVPLSKLMSKFLAPVKEVPVTKACSECLSDIPKKATKCKFCASVQK